MADDTTRIINLTEATEISDGMYLVTDASTGTRKLSLQKVLDKVGGNVADDYDATATYDVGDLVVYKGVLYECSTEISTAEAWNPAHWSRINLGDIVADIDGSIDALNEDKANKSGEYDNIVAGTAKQLLSTQMVEDQAPYLFRTSGGSTDIGNREYLRKIVGGTLGWNQLCNASSVTVTSGHKYYMKKATVESIGASDGTALTGLTSGTDMVIDLTILFGSSVADHIYTLEQATEGSGVAWLKKYFPNLFEYHEYSEPTLKSVEGLVSHDMVGFNAYNPTTGTAKVVGGMQYQITGTYTAISLDGTEITPDSDGIFTPSANGTLTVTGGNDTDTCIHLVWSGTRNGEYEPYEKHSYPLDSTITLRGIPKLVDGQLKADGDYYPPSGDVMVRYGIVDLGTLDWTHPTGNRSVAKLNDMKLPVSVSSLANCITSKGYVQIPSNGTLTEGTFAIVNNNSVAYLYFYYDGTNNPSGDFVYELATPTTESAQPYEELQIVNDFGTEEFVATGLVPVGNVTEYPANLRDKLQHLPDLADGDGYYLIQQVGTQMALVAFHIPKATGLADGTYTLKATVSGGTPIYTWESD